MDTTMIHSILLESDMGCLKTQDHKLAVVWTFTDWLLNRLITRGTCPSKLGEML